MENLNKNTLMIVGIITSIAVSLLTLGLVIFFITRNATPIDASPVVGKGETAVRFLSRGFIGMSTMPGIKEEAGMKLIELRGHVSKTEIPAYEPVSMNDKDVQIIRIGENTKITKITKGKTGEAPTVEEVSLGSFTMGPDRAIYLATYELTESDAIRFDEPATLLEIYIGFAPARQ